MYSTLCRLLLSNPPTNQLLSLLTAPVSADRPSAATTTDPPTSTLQSDRPQVSDRPAASDRPSASAFQPTRRDVTSESDSDSVVSDRPMRARHIPGHLNVIADKLSRHNQVIQTEWSLSQQVFNLLCSRWDLPHVDLFATWFNHKIPKSVSRCRIWHPSVQSLPWENLDAYASLRSHCSPG